MNKLLDDPNTEERETFINDKKDLLAKMKYIKTYPKD